MSQPISDAQVDLIVTSPLQSFDVTEVTNAPLGMDLAEIAPQGPPGPGDATLWKPSEHGFLTWSYDPAMIQAVASAFTAGSLYWARLHLPSASSVKEIVVVVNTGGVTLTEGQNFGALYRNTDRGLIAQTVDITALMTTPGVAPQRLTLAGGPYNLAAGDYLAAVWFNGTTLPTLMRACNWGGYSNLGLATTDLRFGYRNSGLTTTAHGTLPTTSVGNATSIWFGLA